MDTTAIICIWEYYDYYDEPAMHFSHLHHPEGSEDREVFEQEHFHETSFHELIVIIFE